jgi:hypothetical protein
MNRFRKILVRFEKTDRGYLALVHLACVFIAWRKTGIIYGQVPKYERGSMQVILSEIDFRQLSKETQIEIVRLMQSRIFGTESDDGCSKASYTPVTLSSGLARKLVQEPIHIKTLRFLSVFAENDGVAALNVLLKTTGYEKYSQLRGIHTGLLRRLRKLTGNAEAFLYDAAENWEKLSQNDENLKFVMPDQSASVLREALRGKVI